VSQVQSLVSLVKLRIERARARSNTVDIAFTTFKRFSLDDGGSLAAALTYYTFLSIFPLLIFAAAILGYLTFGNDALRERLFEAGVNAAPLLEELLSTENLARLEETRQTLALTGLVLALYSGSGAVVALQHALNRIWRVPEEPNFLLKRLRSLLWLSVLGGAALASVALTAAAELAEKIFESLDVFGGLSFLLLHAAGILVSLLIFEAAFKFLPARNLGWREVLPGALLAAILFELLKSGGAAFIQAGDRGREATFGTAFAAAAGLLVGSYLLCQVTLLCAELNVVLAERRVTRQTKASSAEEAARE